MSRTFDADHLLSVLIEFYQQEEHFILHKEGKIYARIIVTEDEQGPIPFHGKFNICLTDIAVHLAERMSK
ncbi:hypothetical protein L905_10245 [Agrobacterium sp. TS43]|jgi:hypothetical protein|nr:MULTISPECIES: hypothetical protein [Agrobacterium]KDR89748.1 hypothetical protein K538_18350 [Agrobacterium tumefaciens GW4]KVK40086.1 hypothetical protein L904_15595 [Agrobacterium sp. LY4]KVK63652.1 hypothetical protein L906_16315 [Agrobacterium sp. TS45]KVK68080.1 hypothetical protein L907_16275 [Agrobacterium sp. C13]KVK70684.1 hypothetical protein L905_10245 [Agrobacterium sp. TS43]